MKAQLEGLIGSTNELVKGLVWMVKQPNGIAVIGFLVLLAMIIGVIPSPITDIWRSVEDVKEDHSNMREYAKLQLYLSREICMQGAEDQIETSRCNRTDIRDAILDEQRAPVADFILPSASALQP